MKPFVRIATPEDHKAILAIAKQSPYTKDFSNAVMFSSPAAYAKGWIRVAVSGERILGFFCVREKTRAPHTVLYFIGVDASSRSLGVGELLMQELVCFTKHSTVCLNVHGQNSRAKDFYLRFGFAVFGHALGGAGEELRYERHPLL